MAADLPPAQELLDALTEPCFLLDEQLAVVHLNAAASRALGPESAEALGRDWGELVGLAPQDLAWLQQAGERPLDLGGQWGAVNCRVQPGSGWSLVRLLEPGSVAYAELESRYQLVSRQLHDLIYRFWLNPPRFEFVSPSALELTGYAPEEFYADPDLGMKLIHPEDRPLVLPLGAPRPDKVVFDTPMVLRIQRKDGTLFFGEQIFTALTDEGGQVTGFEGALRDVTARIEYEEQMRQAEQKHYQMFETNLAVKLLIDPKDGRIVEANHAACQFYGYDLKTLTSKTIQEINQLTPEQVQEEMRHAEQEKRLYFVFPHRLASGEIRQVEVYSGPVQLGSKTLLYSIIHDITERTRAQARLLEAKAAAEEADQAKGEFMANVSHEIRTPLNAVLGFAELLDPLVEKADARDYLSAIRSSGESLLSLINEILDFSKLEAGRVEVNLEPCDLSALVDEMADVYQREAQAKGLALNCRIEGELPRLRFDCAKLRQIMINLVGNALKFTAKGSIDVCLRGTRRRPEVFDLSLIVEDTGIGIDPSQQESVFESFRQQEGQSDRRYGGTGLGLSIVKSLTELLNGQVHLTSQPGEGSRFEVRFTEIAQAGEPDRAEPISEPKAASIEGAKVLIVDDNASNLALLRAALRKKGLRAIEASDGAEAVDLALSQKPDAILMDLFMPGVDGFAAGRSLKADQRTAGIPLLAVTASKTDEVAERVRQLGFDGIFYKPVRIKDLYQALCDLLSSPAGEPPPKPEWPSDPAFWGEMRRSLGDSPERFKGALDLQDMEQWLHRLETLAQAEPGGRLALEVKELKQAVEHFDLERIHQWVQWLDSATKHLE